MTRSFDGGDDRGPIAWMARNSVAANLAILFLLVGGLLVAPRVKQEIFPEFDLDVVIVSVAYPGASPAEVEQGVVLALEEAVSGIDGVKTVHAVASEGNATVRVEVLLGRDPDRTLADVKAAVDRITSLPEDAERPIVYLASLRSEVISLVIYGDVEEAALREFAERAREELLQDQRITQVEIGGLRQPEISIEIPQRSLREHGLTLEGIAERIRQGSVELPAGGVKTPRGEMLLRTAERRLRGSEFEEMVLLSRSDGTQVRVRDIGRVIDGFRDTSEEARYAGKRAALVRIFRVGEQKPAEIADAVHEYILKAQGLLPPGLELAVWNDTSELLEQRIDLLVRNARLGLLFVFLSLGLFLESRLAFWVTLGIPTSFLGAIMLMPWMGASINMISLFAFILVLGMVVDDAIVIGESTYRHRRQGRPFLQAAIEGTRTVATPVTFSILTTIVAFSPMFFVPGTMGKFFTVIPTIVVVVLLISLMESIFVLPAHLAHSRSPQTRGVRGWIHHHQQRFSSFVEKHVETVYLPILTVAIRRRYLTASLALALLLGTIGLVAGGHVPFTFMPRIDSDFVVARIEMPFGTPIEETTLVQQRALAAAKASASQLQANGDTVRGLFSQLGTNEIRGMGPMARSATSGSHLAQVMVRLVPSDGRAFSSMDFAKRWRESIGEIPGIESLTFMSTTGATGGAPIDVELSHRDIHALEGAAARLADELQGYAGVHDIDDGFEPGKEQIDLRLKPEARRPRVAHAALARQVRAAFFGAEAVRQQRGRDEVRVYVRYPEADRHSERTLEEMLIRAPDGGEVPLGQAARLERGRSYTAITRRDARRVVNVTADVDDKVGNANQIVAGLQRDVLPSLAGSVPGLTYSFEGQQAEQRDSMQALMRGFAMALGVMFVIMAVAFRSYVQPAIVMSVIPFGFIGALGGHMLMGYGLSLMSMMGLVALAGVVVNDSLVFVDAANRARRVDGLGAAESILAAGRARFRAIVLTSLTTFLGLAPMIFETSLQARFLIPMALSLAYGVLFATAITLLLVPSLYLILEDARRGVYRLLGRELPAVEAAGAG